MIADRVMETVKKLDVDVTYRIFKSVPKTNRVKQILSGLEWSCHGIPWLAITLILIYCNPRNMTFKHLMVGLIMDIFYVALLKAYARRQRPTYARQDDQFCVVSVDKHSFPSGHASRAIYFAYFCSSHSFLSFVTWMWASAVVVSRVLLGRHHVGDVIAGSLLGIVNYTIQFTIGLPINYAIMWIISTAIGSQFHTTNDQSDGLLVDDDFDR
ncbi:Phospholipid phosphatase 6 [Halotydeus destructor]|nr:Phospholipid phosphatase 6 [Halotydeus destructor]